jgi:hypothetical protein
MWGTLMKGSGSLAVANHKQQLQQQKVWEAMLCRTYELLEFLFQRHLSAEEAAQEQQLSHCN